MPSSRGPSPSRGRTRISYVFCFAGGLFTCWVIREALKRLVLPEPREDPSKKLEAFSLHSTGAVHGAALGREGRGAGGIRETSAPTAPPASWGPPAGGMQIWQGRVSFLTRQGTQRCCDAFRVASGASRAWLLTADPSVSTFPLALTTQAQAVLTLIAPNWFFFSLTLLHPYHVPTHNTI